MTTAHYLQKLIAASDDILSICRSSSAPRLLQAVSILPDLTFPSQDWFIPPELADAIGPSTITTLWSSTYSHLRQDREATFDAYTSILTKWKSLEEYGAASDKDVQKQICAVLEASFNSQCNKIKQVIRGVLIRNSLLQLPSCRRQIPFSSRALTILEAAYSRTKILTTAETAIIAEAAGITAHQVRTWFQNKRNRGPRRSQPTPTQTFNRPIQSLPKRAQQAKLASPSIERRQVRSLPRRAQGQASHNAPATPILESSLGNYPFDNGFPGDIQGERMHRSSSLTSTISSSTEPNGGFISPFHMHQVDNMPQIAVEWGAGMLNVPVEVLEGSKMPVFNFTPSSPLNLNFNSTFNPYPNQDYQGSIMGCQAYDTPIETRTTSFNPFENPDFDLAAGLESIESMLSSALSDPSSFDNFSTLAASPQISLDSLSPGSDTIESFTSLESLVSSPGWSAGEALDGNFFQALEGLLASPQSVSGAVESGNPVDMNATAGPSRSLAMSSTSSDGDMGGNGLIQAAEGIDLSYIASIPLPPSPTIFTTTLPTFDISDEYKLQSGMCTPSSTTSAYPLITPTNTNAESIVELDQAQWEWMSGVLPFDMVGMEVEMMEYDMDEKHEEGSWMMNNGMRMTVGQ
ncbi:uncharacterized protein IL334_004543 [Kwoniella shivajii]|uniref:Homeobox domain-containing protein n=1 Tax=Kwoniella shivajii TaxID=564305 RepID=A0ABZ1D0L2_9TREE|nr:hypothetical protein IL334_004543 [Kwoniella shivajii]